MAGLASAAIALVGACGDDVDLGGDADAGACRACTSDRACGAGAVCGDFVDRSLCVTLCPTGTECDARHACVTLGSVSGEEVSACAPRPDVCGPDATDAAPPPPDGVCGALVGPSIPASCDACREKPCQANGCYNGWWCDTATRRCVAPPLRCSGAPSDAGKG